MKIAGMGQSASGEVISGAESWLSPGTAITNVEGVFTNPSGAFSSAAIWTTVGLLAVPLVLLMLLTGGRR